MTRLVKGIITLVGEHYERISSRQCAYAIQPFLCVEPFPLFLKGQAPLFDYQGLVHVF